MCELVYPLHGLIRCQLTWNDFDQRQHRRRVEEMHAHDALGAGRHRGEFHDRYGGRIAGEQRIRPDHFAQGGEYRGLGVLVLDRGLGDQVTLGQVVQGVGEPHPVDDVIALADCEFAVADGLIQRSGQACLGALDRGLVDLTQNDIAAAARGDLRNAGPHDAATDDSHNVDHFLSCLSMYTADAYPVLHSASPDELRNLAQSSTES